MLARRFSVLLLAGISHAFPLTFDKRDPLRLDLVSGARTNDVICLMKTYQGTAQFPPPVVSASKIRVALLSCLEVCVAQSLILMARRLVDALAIS
jgi:hypothetical protein